MIVCTLIFRTVILFHPEVGCACNLEDFSFTVLGFAFFLEIKNLMLVDRGTSKSKNINLKISIFGDCCCYIFHLKCSNAALFRQNLGEVTREEFLVHRALY